MLVHGSGAASKENRMAKIINEGRKTRAKASLCHFINPWCSHSSNSACLSRHPTSKRIEQQKNIDKDNQTVPEKKYSIHIKDTDYRFLNLEGNGQGKVGWIFVKISNVIAKVFREQVIHYSPF